MDRAKYIVINHHEVETPIIFPCWLVHGDVANALSAKPENVISAGMLTIDTNADQRIEVYCFGESTTLKKSSRDQIDATLIEHVILT